MSSRITSEFGTLAERLARTNNTATPFPAKHIQARDDTGVWQPALLFGWHKNPDGWWGRVAMLIKDEPTVVDLTARRLRPINCTCCGQGRGASSPTSTGTTTGQH